MKDESRFLDKWKLVRAASKNKRLSLGDISVLFALCDRYGSKYDKDAPALAGHALLGAMSSLSRRATIDSTRRLIEAGYVSVIELGSGTRGTRYGLNFARGEDNCTAKGENASGEAEITTVVKSTSPLDDGSGEAPFTESPPTVSPLQGGIHVVGSKFDAAATPPPAVGQEATAAGTASGDGFDEFWKVWPRKHGIRKARAEWCKIINDVDIIIEVAGDWAAHYATHGTDKKWIPEPANWLRDERWQEDLPIIHGDAKGAAIAKAKANAPAATEREQATPAPDFTVHPDQSASGVIEKAKLSDAEDDGAKILDVWFRTPEGKAVQHMIVLESPDASEQASGQDELHRLIAAAGLSELHDPDSLVGRRVDLMLNYYGGFVSCHAPWTPSQRGPRNIPRFVDVVNNTPLLGWATKIGTSVDDEDDEREAA